MRHISQAVDVAITWLFRSSTMGDKHLSENQKPVKNTLLTGASHGFPFESFQGSSLLIPVSQDSPSVLNDSIGDVNKLDSHAENVNQLSQAVQMTGLEEKPNQEETKNPVQAFSQGYTGIFSSFFGGGGSGQPKKDLDLTSNLTSNQEKNLDRSITSSAFGSSPPFVTVSSNTPSFSPPLQVPPIQGPHKDSHSVNPSEIPLSSGFTVSSRFEESQNRNLENFPTKNLEHLSPRMGDIQEVSSQPPQNEIQHFFPGVSKSEEGSDFGNQSFGHNLGFESFCNSPSQNPSSSITLTRAQSAVHLPVSGTMPTHGGLSFNVSQPQDASKGFYQSRAESADSLKYVQSPPPMGAPAALSPGPPMSLGGPPIPGGTTRTYRRDLYKRPTYAPVPGLTSNTAVSSSYLQPCEGLTNPSSLSSPSLATPPPPALKQPFSGSLSQPALNLSGVKSDLNSSNNSSVHTFFNPPSGESSLSSVQHDLNEVNSSTSTSSFPAAPYPIDSSSNTCHSSSVSVDPSQTSSYSSSQPYMTGSNVSSSVSVHPPIMSTKEQSQSVSSGSSYSSMRPSSPTAIRASLNNLANLGHSGIIYRPAYHHWFFHVETKEAKEIWQPFSMTDSLALEQAFNSVSLNPSTVVPTDGGRYDVNVVARTRVAVYWEEEPKSVRRCSWFYKATNENRLRPYDENTAYILEEEYKKAVMTNTWNRKVDLSSGEYVIMHGPSSIGLFQNAPQTPDGWEAETDFSQNGSYRPKIVKRGVLDDFEIDDGESPLIDHLIFVVHGVGSVCDFKFRTIEEAGDEFILERYGLSNTKIGLVDAFRSKCLQLIKSHFRSSVDQGLVNRVEILPVSWHKQLHGDATGVDKKLQTITLKSIPRLRHFTNDTLLDILFYTSPVYCQNIMQQVGREVNTLFEKFKSRNPSFKGGVSLVGHSLGSLILFDMLCHQKPPSPRMENIQEVTKTDVEHEVTTFVSPDKKKRSLSRNVSYVIGTAGTGQPFIEYPQLSFQPVAFFAMGSPIGMFVTVRGIDSLGLDFCLPTCSRFFNIFHPFDPVAYRIEALINPDLAEKRPVLIPHHKGRKRMHLELKETMGRVAADLKQRLVDSVRSTWNTVYQLTMFGRADDGLEQEVSKVIEKQLERQRTESVSHCLNDCEEIDFNAGQLNQGRRIDYVLQEAPLESFNEYVFAITSHVIYWDSEDTMLLILKEIYGSKGISADNQLTTIPGVQDDITTTSPNFPNSSDLVSTNTPYGQTSPTPPPPTYGFK